MPVTRTGSHRNTHGTAIESVILIPTQEPATRLETSKRIRDPVTKRKPIVLGEVIEISSDDEPSHTTNHVLPDLRRQVKKLKENMAQCKVDLAKSESQLLSAQAEIRDLRAPISGKGTVLLKLSQLEDDLNCEICTSRLWSPHILPECGHTFCQNCLQDWFNTTLAQFINTHPHYDINNPLPDNHQWEAVLRNPQIFRSPAATAYLAQLQQATPQPEYTCPTCRKAVKNRPVEDFALKSLVRTVSAAVGEVSPRKPLNKVTGPRPTGLWDRFFSRAT